MKYAIVNIMWCKSHGIEVLPEMRTSVDQSKVILHEEFLSPFGEEGFPKYESTDPEFMELLASEEWALPEGVEIKEHAGTKDDLIPYAPPMEIFKDKYYTQSKVLYKCIRDSGQPLSHNLSDLVGNYVEKA